MNNEIITYIGIAGLLLGLLFLFVFLIRIPKLFRSSSPAKKRKSKGLLKNSRNFLLIILWITSFVLVLYVGLSLRAYFNFTNEKPVAKVLVEPMTNNGTSLIRLIEFNDVNTLSHRKFNIKGDQWMLEGDILKWDPWLNIFGLETRYRLTRIQGRHIITKDEIEKQKTIYALVEDENHPVWKYFYRYYDKLPFVDAVYGNAVFQNSDEKDTFYVYVSTSGFTTKRAN